MRGIRPMTIYRSRLALSVWALGPGLLMYLVTGYGCTADRWMNGWMDVLYTASI